MNIFSPAMRLRFMKWHRWATLLLLIQLGIWLITAMAMTLIPRSTTTAYSISAASDFDAVAQWPETSALSEIAEGADEIVVSQPGFRPILTIDDGPPRDPVELIPAEPLSPDRVASFLSQATGETISAEAVRLKTSNTPEYQKLPVPAWRVEAEQARIFLDPVTGAYLGQTTPMKHFENWVTTIHVMDYTGRAQFRSNILLTFFGLLFLSSAIFGIIAVRRLYARRKAGLRSLKLHQTLGILLALQVVFWTTSGLGVVWALHPLRDIGENLIIEEARPIAWDRVVVHPRSLVLPDGEPPVQMSLRMLLGEPVYEAVWAGRPVRQALWRAEDGTPVTIGEPERDAILTASLNEQAVASLSHWETAEGPADLDFYFYTGPWPVWKGYFSEPVGGAVAVDQTTGRVHVPRTDPEIALERYYNVHVVNWRFGVARYRLEPALIIVILLAAVMFVTGVMLQLRRWRR
jgi:uncharacterized iron-regulated membrane protein